jgi:hypothetical protein
MKSALHWTGNLSLTHGAYEVPTLEDFELNPLYLYEERQKLIEALEWWLESWRWDANA